MVLIIKKTQLTSNSIMRLLLKSALFPAKAITMLALACLWSSLTQVFALAKVSCNKITVINIHKFKKKTIVTTYLTRLLRKTTITS